MARPNVTTTVVDNSFIISGSESGSPHTSGMFSSDLVTIFGVTSEKTNGYMTIDTAATWFGRLNGTTYGGVTGEGPTGAWKNDWYSAYNYLLYGGTLVISSTSTGLYDTNILLDSVFTSSMSDAQTTFVTNTAAVRDDLIGVIGVTYAGYASGTAQSGVTASPSGAESASSNRLFLVGGEKQILGLSNSTVGENFVTISLASDVAGCLARTDREFNLWFPPAGTTRGRVLNVIRLIKNPSPTEQDYLYESKINSVIGVPGEGVFLFGDKTKESQSTSSLTRVNVVRLINYIKKTLTRSAQDLLFELNDDLTRSQFRNTATSFLQNIKDSRGLIDFSVVCDETNNTADIIDANQFVADIYIKPTKSINYVKLVITNLNTSANLPGG